MAAAKKNAKTTNVAKAVETKKAAKAAKVVVVETKAVETVAAKVVAKVSNKARIYALWLKAGGAESNADPVALRNRAKAQSAVKEQTVTNWVNGWARGKRLPGCARKSA